MLKTIIDYIKDDIQFPPSDVLLPLKRIEFAARSVNKAIAEEKAVATFYYKTTATFCAPVVSKLTLRDSNWLPLLLWTQSNNDFNDAIADGSLRITTVDDLALQETHLKFSLRRLRAYRLWASPWPNYLEKSPNRLHISSTESTNSSELS